MNRKLLIELKVWLMAMPGLSKTMEEKLASLPPIQRFHFLGWDTFLFDLGTDFAFGNRVLVLGGYKGRTTKEWLDRGASSVTVFEPIPSFAEVIRERFLDNPKVTLIESAVGNESGFTSLTVDDDKTGGNAAGSGKSVDVPVIDFGSWLARNGQGYALTEINIEGAEYALLTRLDHRIVRNLGAILIQTHNVGSQTKTLLSSLTGHLSITHSKVIDLPHVWTFWVPKVTN